ncbi:MAG TPA: hypothetical protein VLN45_04105 [Ignavibacteriaceae bacterium]|nr:hypothetical protein [Ignavibacteriaceae bacterium]
MLFNGLSVGVVLGFLTAFAYTGLGIYLVIKGDVFEFSPFQKYGLGILIISYGFFRFYRTLKKKKDNILQEQIDENDE